MAQLAPLGARLSSLELRDYRMLGGLLGSLAGALPALRHLALGAARVEGGMLDLAPLSRLQRLQRLELCLLGGRHGDQVVVTALAPGATALTALTALHLAHVHASEPAPALPAALVAAQQLQAEGLSSAGAAQRAPPRDFWSSLALLPALAELTYEEQQLRAREPPAALLALPHLRSLTIRLEGFIHADGKGERGRHCQPTLAACGMAAGCSWVDRSPDRP